MKRRAFIRKTGLGVSAGLVSSSFLASCTAKGAADALVSSQKIAIVGAGAAGLYAATLLPGQEVTIFEATDKPGGRIRALKGFADFDLEAGSEEIKGKNSIWYDWVSNFNLSFVDNKGSQNYYTLDTVLRKESDLAMNPDFQAINDFINQATIYNGADRTVLAHLQQSRVPPRVYHVVNAALGNENGTSQNKISIKGLAEANQTASAGKDVFRLAGRTFNSVLEERCKAELLKVKYNTPIQRVVYDTMGVVLFDAAGIRYQFDKVIMTVPVSLYQNDDIIFSPPLPQTKVDAFKKIGMGAGMKIIMSFSRAFWPADADSIFGRGVVPEYVVASRGRSTTNFILSATVMGDPATAFGTRPATIISSILADLDSIFGRNAASTTLLKYQIIDWSQEPFTKGAYSYPIVGGGLAANRELAQPLLGRLFFAGEATHFGGHAGTVHGAMESARRAVEEVLRPG